MSGGQLTVPLVLRTQGGAGQRGAAQHSQSLEAWLDARARAEGRDAEHGGRRGRPAPSGDRRPEPGRLRREQDALLPPRGGAAGASRADRPKRGRPAGTRCHVVALSRLVPRGGRGSRGARGGGDRGRGDRPAHARSARPRDDRRVGRRGRTGSSSPTRRSRTAASARRSPRRCRRPRSTSSTRRSRGSAPRSRRSRSARRSRTPFYPAATRSSRAVQALSRRLRPVRLGAVSILGNRVLRKEDGRFLRGQGTYVENLPLEGARLAHLRPLAVRAREDHIVDTSAAADLPGVEVLTGADVDVAPLAPPPIPLIEPRMLRPAVAKDVVRFVGEIVAVVISDDRATGVDAAELVMVDYDPLPAVVDPDEASEGRGVALPGRRHERCRQREPARVGRDALRRLRRDRLGHARQPAHGRLPARGALRRGRGRRRRPPDGLALDAGAAPGPARPRRHARHGARRPARHRAGRRRRLRRQGALRPGGAARRAGSRSVSESPCAGRSRGARA